MEGREREDREEENRKGEREMKEEVKGGRERAMEEEREDEYDHTFFVKDWT